MSTIGERLRKERDRLGCNQTDFAAYGGVQKRAQVNYEANQRHPDASYLAGIAAAGADIAYIVTAKHSDAHIAEGRVVDWDLLEQVIIGVDAFLNERKAKLRSDKKAGLIRVLYAKFSEEKNLNQTRFKDFMEAVMATV